VRSLLALAAALLACSPPEGGANRPPPRDERPPPPPADAAATDRAGAPPCPGRGELAPGLVAERVLLPGRDDAACLTLVRIDLARHRLEVRTARADGGVRPAPGWAADFGLAAAMNTSMFGDDLRSIGLLRDARAINSDRDNPKQGGFLAFDPVDPSAPPAVLVGRGCPGFDLAALRRRYRGLVQDYRLLDCDGGVIRWADPKIYSAAGIALDRDGRIVFFHARVPMDMTALSRVLADLDLAGALYAEGGPEASLVAGPVAEVGSFETGFFDDSNRRFWDIPNVLGAAPR
jgi:hypothetical protein